MKRVFQTRSLTHIPRSIQAAAVLVLVLVLFIPRNVASADSPAPPTQTPAPTACADILTCPTPEDPPPPLVDPIWWNNHKINQINPDTYTTASDLLTNPYNTCGPTTLALIINYIYYLRDPQSAPQVTANQVLLAAKDLGYFKPPDNDGLLGAEDLRAIARQFGLSQRFPKGGDVFTTFDSFLNEVKKGFPAIAGMRFAYDKDTGEYLPTGDASVAMNHYAIVFGITDDGNYFWVLNTHPGLGKKQDADVSLRLMTFDQFRASWAKNDGSEVNDYGVAIFLR